MVIQGFGGWAGLADVIVAVGVGYFQGIENVREWRGGVVLGAIRAFLVTDDQVFGVRPRGGRGRVCGRALRAYMLRCPQLCHLDG